MQIATLQEDEVRACKLEVRKAEDGHIKGYPILFNVLSVDLGGFRERILPDAIQFADDLRADFNHDPNYILGRTLAGTLKVSTDTRGVFMDVDPPATSWARDLMASIKRGDIDQGSFSFRILPGGQQITEENGQQVANAVEDSGTAGVGGFRSGVHEDLNRSQKPRRETVPSIRRRAEASSPERISTASRAD